MKPRTPKKKAAKTTTGARRRPKLRQAIVPMGRIERSILLIRGEKVMPDADLAGFYDVQTKMLVREMTRK